MEVEGATSFELPLNNDELLLNNDATQVREAVTFDAIFPKYRGRM